MRLFQLGQWPPGLYRDEAYNGLDALSVLRGDHALFFPANNGREPFFIYFVALAVALFGPTAFALRLPAALVGALATLPTYLLGRTWFGRAAGLLAAWLWAATFWPVHLGRIGLRAGLLAPLLALSFWVGTRAYRERRATLWFLAGLVYGLSFYTYLAARFTPLLLGLFAGYLVATGRRDRLWDAGRVMWFVLGAVLAVAPLGFVIAGDPSILFGRAGQVSIFSPDVSGGDPLSSLMGNTFRALGMYFVRGDAILRHNALLSYETGLSGASPAGRPVFDWLMAGPFIAGLIWCVWRWRRPPAAFLLLWQLVMLGPTILAEDAPHFLRAAGILPGAVFFPAIGLALLWDWARLPTFIRRAGVILLLAGSLWLTIRDYATYARQPDVAFLWETAAADLARSAASDSSEKAVFIDRRFADGWPSIRFLLGDALVTYYDDVSNLPTAPGGAAVYYAWPYGSLQFLGAIAQPPARVTITSGPLARGDLEPEPYSLYTRYAIAPGLPEVAPLANFDDLFLLRGAADVSRDSEKLDVDLQWQPGESLADTGGRLPNVFVHVVGPEGMLAQYDGPIGSGLWPADGWQPHLAIGESHQLSLPRTLDPAGDRVEIGLYWAGTNERLTVLDGAGEADDKVIIWPTP